MNSTDISKIQPDHLHRLAYIYVRQSSLHQVQYNTASTVRQYNLIERAKELGWADEKIIVVDQDQGQSGASLAGRDGFKIMMKDILMGNVGAVLSLEASRLARDSSDWHLLVKLCVTRNTLIIDEVGIHNPRVFNDRLLLSIKGTLSEAELHLIASRLNGGRLQRAKEGKLRFLLPAGYVYDSNGNIVIDTSPEIQQTVRLFFDKFDELGSCLSLVRYFRRHNLLLPNRFFDDKYHSEHRLRQMTASWARMMLHNPTYAGMYVYGRSRTDVQVISAETMETGSRRVRVPSEEWEIVIRNNHEAYISEDRYRRNIQRLKDNRIGPVSPGAINRGPALLQGLARCGVCGRSLQVQYPGKKRRTVYECIGTRKTNGGGRCQLFAGAKIEGAVIELVLRAFDPAQLELAEAHFTHWRAEVDAIRDQWRLQLKEAQNEADAAGRLFKQAAIHNRHVAGQLQDEWEKTLKQVEEIRQTERELPSPPSQDGLAFNVQRLVTAAQNLEVIWNADSTSNKDRKQLIRLLIKDVILLRRPNLILLTVRWASGGRLEMEIPWLSWAKSHATDAEIIEIIEQMAPTNPDRLVAERLNALGHRRRWGQQKFTSQAVNFIRRHRNIPQCPELCPAGTMGPRSDGRYNTQNVARMLGLHRTYIGQLCKQGKLPAVRSSPTSPWWINIDTPEFGKLREAIEKRKANAVNRPLGGDKTCASR